MQLLVSLKRLECREAKNFFALIDAIFPLVLTTCRVAHLALLWCAGPETQKHACGFFLVGQKIGADLLAPMPKYFTMPAYSFAVPTHRFGFRSCRLCA